MSIRKHSVTTPRPDGQTASPRPSRVAGWIVTACIVIGVLAGCAEGTSSDAERGKARDAQRTSVVSDLQATQSARLLEPGTPPPTTTVTPE